jgi:hypothetical protein
VLAAKSNLAVARFHPKIKVFYQHKRKGSEKGSVTDEIHSHGTPDPPFYVLVLLQGLIII